MKSVIDNSVRLQISGMSCASCVARIEKALLAVSGVKQVSVNLATESAQIMLAEPLMSPQPLLDAITQIGFRASVPEVDQVPVVQPLDRSWLWSLLLTIPLVLPMVGLLWQQHWMLPAWLQWALASVIQFGLGARFYRAGWLALRAGVGNMDLLVALGTSAAYGLSLYLCWQAWPAEPSALYFETSAVVMSLILLGKHLEQRAKQQTSQAIRELQQLRPQRARVLLKGREREIPLSQLVLDDQVVVLPGERVPVDGEIIEGSSHLDESLLTGESLPVSKQVGMKVSAGSLNQDGRLLVRAVALGQQTLLAQIIQLVESAQASKPPIQRQVDKVSAVFVPVVVVLALLTYLGWGLLAGDWQQALLHAVAVLVIACPCALGLATPAAIMVGTGVAARHGILIQDIRVLEQACQLRSVAFDKTGTLTTGQLRLLHYFPYQMAAEQVLSQAASLQQGSEHPLARAVLAAAEQQGLTPLKASETRVLAGLGIRGELAGDQLLLGSQRLMLQHQLDLSPLLAEAEQALAQGYTLAWLAQLTPQPHLLGLLVFGDQIREQSLQAISHLQQQHVFTVLISGDQAGSVARVADELKLDQYFAEVLPADKANLVRELQQHGPVAMVGDGINDAPALACADIGIAMGSGTDIAMHSAAITLMRPDPRLVAAAIDISQRSWQKIRQNLFWAFIYNLICIPLAALGYLSPMLAGGAMALSSISVLINALLLKRWQPKW